MNKKKGKLDLEEDKPFPPIVRKIAMIIFLPALLGAIWVYQQIPFEAFYGGEGESYPAFMILLFSIAGLSLGLLIKFERYGAISLFAVAIFCGVGSFFYYGHQATKHEEQELRTNGVVVNAICTSKVGRTSNFTFTLNGQEYVTSFYKKRGVDIGTKATLIVSKTYPEFISRDYKYWEKDIEK